MRRRNFGVESKSADGLDRVVSRREALRDLGLLGVGLASAGALVSACSSDSSRPKKTPPANAPPNILLIIADDMRYDELVNMPRVLELIQEPGRAFTQARCNVPLCQPSRVGLLTGQMSKDNQEIGIGFNGTQLRDRDNCLGKWMNDAGYRCGFFGKYVNFWDGFGGVDAPAGYSTWRELIGESSAYDFDVRLNAGTSRIRGQYSSDYLAAQATEFMRGVDPFMCIVTPTQPHTPFRPRKDLEDAWSTFHWPIVEEDDVSDKPAWIRELPPLSEAERVTLLDDARGSLRELSAVDDMVDQIISSMDAETLAHTVVIFASDNGVHRGEHRRTGAGTKSGPYEVGLHVPLLVRGPGFEPGPDITAPSLVFQDIAATMLDLGGARAGLPHQTGISLAEICGSPGRYSERVLLHEIGEGFLGQTGDGMTTGPDSSLGFRKLYRYPSVRASASSPYVYEAYDLDTDPNEFRNWANDAARLNERNALEQQLDAQLGRDARAAG